METRRSLHASSAAPFMGKLRSSKAGKGLRKLGHRNLGLEPLEARQLLAIGPQLVAVLPNEGADLLPDGLDPLTATRHVAPREITFRFNDGQVIDATTLNGILITGSGGDGIFGNGNDVVVDPIRAGAGGAPRGFVGLGNFPNEVVLRFAETLPDDLYQITIVGSGLSPLKNTVGEPFNNGVSQVINLDLDRGLQILGVVPQPVTRDGGGNLVQNLNTVEVYFDPADPPSVASAQNVDFYDLIFTNDTATTLDDATYTPVSATYVPAEAKVVLDFGMPLHLLGSGAGTYRLRVGDDALGVMTSAPMAVGEIGSTFGTSTNVGTLSGAQSQIINSSIDFSGIPLPALPGANTDPGNRELLVDQMGMALNSHIGGAESGGPFVEVLEYNFRPGPFTNPAGTFFNNITENQKQRAREIFALYSYYTGVQFVETESSGWTIMTGDVRAAIPTLPPVGGPTGISGNPLVINETLNFGISEFGGLWFTIAMHEIGHNLGLGHAYELPSITIQGDGSPLDIGTDPVYPGDHDITHVRALHRPDIQDIDLYRFQLDAYGQFSAETVAERLATTSQLDSVLTLYEEIDTLKVPAGSITAALDGKSFTINDGSTSVTFIFDADNSVVDNATTVSIDFTVAGVNGQTVTTTPQQLAAAIAAAINSHAALKSDAVAVGDTVKVKGNITLTPGALLPLVHKVDYRDLVARNDDYYSEDSYLDLRLGPGVYFVVVSSSGNTAFDPEVPDSGNGGKTFGDYTLRLNFIEDPANTIVDADGVPTALDGDADGRPGGLFNFWFKVADDVTSHTVFVDKAAAPGGDGSLASPYNEIDLALADPRLANANPLGAGEFDILRIVGNGGDDNDLSTLDDNYAYEIGVHTIGGGDLSDGRRLDIPRGVTVMVDAGAIFKMRQANITAGSTAQGVNRSEGHLQVLGTPQAEVFFTSFHDETIGKDTLPMTPTLPARGDWGGLVFRNDLDYAEMDIPSADSRRVLEQEGIFLNFVNRANLRYGGGQVVVNSQSAVYQPIYMDDARPTITHNTIINSADAAMSADPASFADTKFQSEQLGSQYTADYERVGPHIRGNRLTTYDAPSAPISIVSASNTTPITITTTVPHGYSTGDKVVVAGVQGNLAANGPFIITVTGATSFVLNGSAGSGLAVPNTGTVTKLNISDNSVNGMFVRIRQNAGTPIDVLSGPGRWDDTDITHILTENLLVQGTPGGPFSTTARIDGRLAIDPGTVVKLEGARIELGFGAQLLAEGTAENRVVFTSLRDDTYGFGGTFDTNGNFSGSTPNRGDWGGVFFGHTSTGSIDNAVIRYGGGNTRIEGDFDRFNVIEIHQADVRVTNSLIEQNDDGAASTSRVNRQGNAAATIFVRGSQPVIVNNIIRDNDAVAVNINVNSLQARLVGDWGRSTGSIDAFAQFNDNYGPLVRLNRLGNNAGGNGMNVRGGNLNVASVWDDTDIVHILTSIVQVMDLQHYGGLRLQSSETESLVVKLSGPNSAGFTATGLPLDINDRVGGTIHVVGTPEYPVVLTSLSDDTVGAGLNTVGQPMLDTNNNGPSTGSPGQWRSIRLDKFSNDRNSAIIREKELPYTGGVEANGTAPTAQFVGTLAANQKSGDDNRRLGIEVQGTISWDDTTDVDVYSFRGVAGSEVWLDIDFTTHALDTIVELVLNDGSDTVIARSDNSIAETTAAGLTTDAGQPGVGMPAIPVGTNLGRILQRDGFQIPYGRDFYTTNPRDAGMRVVLPGAPGTEETYFVRVRSKGSAIDNPKAGESRGAYTLQIRTRELDEFPGSTIRYADLRFGGGGGTGTSATIELLGVPYHSPLSGESRETTATNDAIAQAQGLGNLLEQDRNTISVSGGLTAGGDVDWYSFGLNYREIQSIGSVNAGDKTWSLVLDVDYADGLTRGDTNLAVFDRSGTGRGLIYFGGDSNVADDQPDPLATSNTTDLSRGSFGTLDPYIGPIQLPAAGPGASYEYRVGMSSDQRLPTVLNQFFTASPAAVNTRLEPINSVNRIAEDRIGYQGGSNVANQNLTELFTGTNGLSLNTHAVPFRLSDVVLFVNQSGNNGRLFSVDPYSGRLETDIGDLNGGVQYRDIVVRDDGRLVGLSSTTGTPSPASFGNLHFLDTGNAALVSNQGDDGINIIQNDGMANVVQTARAVLYEAWAYTGEGDNNNRQLFAVGNIVGAENSGNPNEVDLTPQQERNVLYRLHPDNGAAQAGNATNAPPSNRQPISGSGITGLVDGTNETVTGMEFLNGTMYIATDAGRLYTLNTGNAVASPIAGGAVLSAGGAAFAGLTKGPQNVEGGMYADLLFTITTNGILQAFETDGTAQPIFDTNGDGMMETQASTGVGSAAGLSFSPVDYNLWHFTDFEPGTGTNATLGHGVGTAPDNSVRGDEIAENGANGSFYFGLEDSDRGTTLPLNLAQAQPGSDNFSTNNTVFNTYNVPGGAHGALMTNPFSLEGYTAEDKPTLYFTYFLQTQGAQANGGSSGMRDSARVHISTDGGLTWHMLATNNSAPDPDGFSPPMMINTSNDSELPEFKSFSHKNSSDPRQRIQELYDTNNWRQARIDLGQFAGQMNLMLRFDFATAGQIGDPSAPADSQYAIAMPGDQFGNAFGINGTLAAAAQRGQNNNFRGFFIDDVIVGFAERGEMVLNAPGDVLTYFTANVDPTPDFTVLISGEYQLEIRRGPEYGNLQASILPDILLLRSYDTNDRHVQDFTLTVPDGSFFNEGDTLSISDGANRVTFTFTASPVSATDISIAVAPSNATMAARITAAINNVHNAGLLNVTAKRVAESSSYALTDPKIDLFHAALVDVDGSPITKDSFDTGIFGFGNEGDRNHEREQGMVIIQQNRITRSAGYAITLDEGARDNGGNTPHPGSIHHLRQLNINQQWVPGAVVENNVISGGTLGGILISGDPNVTVAAPVPFARILNNTIFGAATPLGVGIDVTQRASPTILNNIVSNLQTGIRVDATSQSAGTVLGGTVYKNNTTNFNTGGIGAGSFPILMQPNDALFVDPLNGNFYLAQGSLAIDSSIETLPDRPELVNIYTAAGLNIDPTDGIGRSNILAPELDVFGNQRTDDPTVSPVALGLGANVFIDRGALERVNTITIDDVTVNPEGNAGTFNAVFTVTLTRTDSNIVTVVFTTSDGTAAFGADYNSSTGTLTFNPGESVKTITIQTLGDTLDEVNETFFVNLGNETNAVVARAQGTGTIVDDDLPPELSVQNATIVEGDFGLQNVIFTLELTSASGQVVSVNFGTASGPVGVFGAQSNVDFQSTAGVLTFTPGFRTANVTVQIISDQTVEADETFFLNLNGVTNATFVGGVTTLQAVGLIQDDDAKITVLDATPAPVVELDPPNNNQAVFEVRLSGPSPVPVTVEFTATSGVGPTGATAGVDFAATSGTITFSGSTTTALVTVPVFGDLLNEFDETFTLVLSNPTNAVIQDGLGVATIQDTPDPAPNIFINNVSLAEGNAGTTNFVFDVTLDFASSKTVTVEFSTADGTALQPSDYSTTSGTLTFTPGQTVQQVTVQVAGDGVIEGDESFFVNLLNPTEASIGDGQGEGVILEDEPFINIADATPVLEGNPTPAASAVFQVTLDLRGNTSFPTDIVVSFSTGDGTATLADTDYTMTSGMLTFSAATTETVKFITVSIVGDVDVEPDETFFVNLTNLSPTLAQVIDNQGTATIIDDEPRIRITPSSKTIAEGNAPGTTPMTFDVELLQKTVGGSFIVAPGGAQVTVVVTAADISAQLGNDYNFTNQTLTFAALTESVKTVTATILGDAMNEPDESFTLTLSMAANGEILIGEAVATGVIDDDDATPSAFIQAIAGSTVTEGNAGTTDALFAVQLDNPSGQTVEVVYRTFNDTALAGSDFNGIALATVTFLPGETSKNITVQVLGDNVLEADETFHVDLVGGTNVNLLVGQTRATGTILDDEPRASILGPVTVTEGQPAVFTIELDQIPGANVEVVVNTSSGTAIAGTDFNGITNLTVTFLPGQTTRTVTVTTVNDTIDEEDENFTVNISGAPNLVIGASATGNILDDDDPPIISIAGTTVAEGDSTIMSALFAVTLPPGGSGKTVTVEFATANGTSLFPAVAGSDYNSTIGTITFLPGQTSRTITVQVLGDLVGEANEDFRVMLMNPVNGAFAGMATTATATGLIVDNEPRVSISDRTVVEGDGVLVNADFTVTLSKPSDSLVQVLVSYTTVDGTAVGNTRTVAAGAHTTTTFAGPLQLSNADDFYVGRQITFTSGALAGQTVTVIDYIGATRTFTVSPALPVPPTAGDAFTLDPADYITVNNTVVFNPGETVKSVMVPIVGDLLDEDNETFFVDLISATNALILDGQGMGTIVDNDPLPSLVIEDASVTEGNSGTVDAVFRVALSAASGRNVTVAFATANQTPASAQGGPDYDITSGILTFLPGESEKFITVVVNGDVVGESDETFLVNLSAPTNATLADGQALGTIFDDEPRLIIGDVIVNEADGIAVFDVTLVGTAVGDVSVGFSTSDGTAVQPADYTATAGALTFTFALGETLKQVTVPIVSDLLDENSETFFVNLAAASSNAVILDGQAQATILDDDLPPTVNILDQTVTEGNAGTVNAVFTVELSAPSGLPITVAFSTSNGTATVAGNDYNPNSGIITFSPGSTTQTITVQVRGDTLAENNETFVVDISSPVNATLGDSQAVGTILDDEPRVSIADVTVVETDGTSTAIFSVTLDVVPSGNVTVGFSTAPGTALAGLDYLTTSGTLTFNGAMAETVKTITVSIVGDLLDEADETFLVNLTSVSSNALLLDNQAMGTIQDNDPPPSISIGDITLQEGNGSVNAVFPVTLSSASGLTITVQFDTADGIVSPATAGSDYVAVVGGTVTFLPGQTQRFITVQVNGDQTAENDETFLVNLSSPVNATLADSQAIATIVDDEPLVSINSVTVTESNGDVNAVFLVQLDRASTESVIVAYFTNDGTAVAPDDYTSIPSGLVTFIPGQVLAPVTVVVKGDLLNEPSETFTVSLSAVTTGNAKIATGAGTGTGTILNDDAQPTVSVSSPSPVTEGSTPPLTTPVVFQVALSAASGQTVTVAFQTLNGSALSPADYSATSGTLTFNPGETVKNVSVQVLHDTLGEPNETFQLQLSSPVNAVLGTSVGTATIQDDEPRISINDVVVTEGDANTTATFTVTLTGTASGSVVVEYATAVGTATAGTDYLAINNGTLTFLAGQTLQTISVTIVGDLLDEADETFFVNLTSVSSNAVIADSQGLGTIVDNDPQPVLSIADVTHTEGDGPGTTQMVFNVTLSAASGRDVTVNFATTANTATPGADFQLTSGVLNFTAGTTLRTITVDVVGDLVGELDETFTVTLSGAANAIIGDAVAVGTIVDNDPRLSINDVTIVEQDSGSTAAVFQVLLSRASASNVTVAFSTVPGTAAASADFLPTSGTLTFTPGVTQQFITVLVQGDLLDEVDETFSVNLSNAFGAAILDGQGIGTIQDNDPLPSLAIDSVTITEGNTPDLANAVFNVTLSPVSGRTVTVEFTTTGFSATDGVDYTPTSGTLTFTAGQTVQQITVQVIGDLLPELDETFQVNLLNATDAVIATATGLGVIADDEPRLSINDVSVVEPDAGTVDVVFTVVTSQPSSLPISVVFSTAPGTATDPADYQGTSGTLTFAPGSTTVQITVTVAGDTLQEVDETFLVNLSLPVNAVVLDSQGVGTILDNDPRVSISAASVTETDAGTATMSFNVTLSQASSVGATVVATTSGGTANTGVDFTPTSATLTFAPGETVKTFTVDVLADDLDEDDETFSVTLSAAVNAVIQQGVAAGTILDDDDLPQLAINDVSVLEGNSGTPNSAVFTISLDAPSGRDVTVSFAALSGTAVAGDDFVDTSGTITITPGVTLRTITVPIQGDTLEEANETFTLVLTGAINATLPSVGGVATILDDDPLVTVNDLTIAEANSGTNTQGVFTISLSKSIATPVVVSFTTVSGTATAGTDFTPVNGTVTFAPGQTTRQVTVTVLGDNLDEVNETFDLNLAILSSAGQPGDLTGRATITDNDPTPNLSINSLTLTEGNAGTKNFVFTATLSAASGQVVTVAFTTNSGTALAGSDFQPTAGTLSIQPGQTQGQITVAVTSDTIIEADESFTLNLSSASGAILTGAVGTGVILNDDAQEIFVTGADAGGGPHVRVFEGQSGAEKFSFFAYHPAFGGGVRVAAGDVNGDGVPDVVTAPGRGGGPHVRVFDGKTGQVIHDLFAFESSFTKGLQIAVGDVNGDGRADLIVGTDGDPTDQLSRVRIFDGATAQLLRDIALDVNSGLSFPTGVRVAAGDVDGDGNDDVILGAAPGAPPRVAVIDALSGGTIASFFAYNPAFGGGIYVAGGDVNGDGTVDIITGPGAGGGPHVRVFNGVNTSTLIGEFFAYHPAFTGGVRVGATDFNRDGSADLVTAAGPGGGPHVRVLSGVGFGELASFFAYHPAFSGGVNTGGSFRETSAPLYALGGQGSGAARAITQEDLLPLVQRAISDWQAAGLDASLLERLQEVEVRIADLPDGYLGMAHQRAVVLDADAAGHGWFVDATPWLDEEFELVQGRLQARRESLAAEGIDLLTALAHELGHVLGLKDVHSLEDPDGLMADALGQGVRRAPTAQDVDAIFGSGGWD